MDEYASKTRALLMYFEIEMEIFGSFDVLICLYVYIISHIIYVHIYSIYNM